MTFFGIAESDGSEAPRIDTNPPIYPRPQGRNFLIVVEGRRGPNNVRVGTTTFNSDEFDPSARPDLQIRAGMRLGNGSAYVCDNNPDLTLGGVPALSSFDPDSQTVANALNDLACRFGVHSFENEACTRNSLGIEAFRSRLSQVQFCTEPPVSGELQFLPGDTLMTVRLRDENGGVGDPKQMIVRVPTPP